MNSVSVQQGKLPVILAQPHGGTDVPEHIWKRLNKTGRTLADTDWHINRLYEGLMDDATVVQSNIHRYAIDANRGPDNASLYPGQNTTGLCPLTNFDGDSIYRPGMEPNESDIEQRRRDYHAPYHQALESEINRLKMHHRQIILYDCHSIRSQIPYLFNGCLPDFNIGTYKGTSCDARIQSVAEQICSAEQNYTCITNGRFKGGWTTRHYGQPLNGVHAIQMELAQQTYMAETEPWEYDKAKADKLRKILRKILHKLSRVVKQQE